MNEVEFNKFLKELKVNDIIKVNLIPASIELNFTRELIIIITECSENHHLNPSSYKTMFKCIMDSESQHTWSILGETMRLSMLPNNRWEFEKL
jgi:hypothetical protein